MITKIVLCSLCFIAPELIQWVIRKLLNLLPASKLPTKYIKRCTRILLWLVALIFAASIALDKSPAILLSGLGASSMVAVFALKDYLSSFISGCKIALENVITPNKYVKLKRAGVEGDVKDITISKLILINEDAGEIHIPIKDVAKDIITIID